MNDTIYAYDYEQDVMVYREPGKRHGDGQVDSDDSPVWLLAKNQFLIFQHGYGVLGGGSTLFDAHEDAQRWTDGLPAYEDIEMFEAVQSPVDGRVYWTNSPDTMNEIQ